ncbi:choice-of-anchor J domain-containing protein [Draconibacterium sp. IB214405]|uniref:choice-of-anchor J domain-containing protein n=1 Tax=Draconibacterium sp. IB214405 TaxID=3097352 RepID=UPI002A166CEB|nr:choice-of-anchor J domain-containing protein [Draconibacterium sp. IB214405]MDX8337948.1 choice-of-anchor J domain-containing protein [Draconibacterium sp. IB214405]
MKKIIFLFSIAALFTITSCDPMGDINDTIDAQDNPIVGDAEYTLTDDDYDALDLSYGNFSSEDDAKAMLPDFLTDKYPIWGKGSSVLVGYKLYVGSAPGVSDYTYADDYSLANDDYPQGSIGAIAFFPNEDAEDYLADILADGVEGAADGDNILVKYKQYSTEPVAGYSNFYEVDFTSGSLNSFEAFSVVGDQAWVGSNYGAKMSGYSGGSQTNEDWLVSPEIDLTDASNLTFQISQIANYSTQIELLNVMVSTDYTSGAQPSTATWTALTIETKPAGNNWDPVLSEAIDFSAYEGETIHIAFKYESTTETSATWEIESCVIKAAGVEGTTVNKEIFYTFDGEEWEASEGVYFVSDADFDSMGEAYGQPGYYNNFSSSITPTDYLGTFLTMKYPYAQDDDEIIIVYDYYSSSSGAQLRGNLYTFTEGAWTNYESTQSTSLQFGHDGTTWVPDNTIKYTLTAADYTFIVDNYSDKYASYIATIANYQDFDYNWTDEMILDVLNGVLKNNFPSSEEGQKFAVTYLMYDGGAFYETMYVILSGGEYVLQ